MKSKLIFLMLVMVGMVAQAQKDVVYKTDGDSIVDCKILEINVGNLVDYSKASYHYQVEAIAILINGEYINLSDPLMEESLALAKVAGKSVQTLDYDYYEETYLQARSVRNTGRTLVLLGLTSCAVSVVTYNHFTTEGIPLALFFAGGVMGDLGIALWIYGGIKSSNNLKAMKRSKPDVSLSFGGTANGVGFKLSLN